MVKSIQRILVGVDDSPVAHDALLQAALLAKATEARLYIVTIVDFHRQADVTDINIENVQKVKDYLDQCVREVAELGVEDVQALHTVGTPHYLLAQTLPKQLNIDLLVIGPKGQAGKRGIPLGSVVTFAMKHVSVPLWIARKRAEDSEKNIPPLQNILVPVDGSWATHEAFLSGVSLAMATNATLNIAGIFEGYGPEVYSQKLYEEGQNYIKDLLVKLVDEAHDLGLDNVRPIFTIGTGYDLLTQKLPNEYQTDLIILPGSDGSKTEKRRIKWQTSQIAKYVPTQVLITPLGKDQVLNVDDTEDDSEEIADPVS